MDSRRRELGKKVARARKAAGYRSQRTFADAAGVSEKGVADVERGDTRPGESTFWAIEEALGWPENGTLRYLASGRPEDLAALQRSEPEPEPESEPVYVSEDSARATAEGYLSRPLRDFLTEASEMARHGNERLAEDWLWYHLDLRREARKKLSREAEPGNTPQRDDAEISTGPSE